jgi:uncharacterized protein (DUF2147 family)
MLMRKGAVLLVALVGLAVSVKAQSITGKWKTIDDESGEDCSIVEIFERQGKYFGKVVRIFSRTGEDADPICEVCPEDDGRHGKKIIGMEIIRDMEKVDEYYGNGDILDPKIGKIYRCKLWINGKELKVRGFWGPFYRTQTWQRSNWSKDV